MTATTPGICWDCGGPCATYKGTVHGWRCRTCVDRYLDKSAGKAAKADAKSRSRMLAKQTKLTLTMSGDTNDDNGSRGGGGSGYGPHRHQDDPSLIRERITI